VEVYKAYLIAPSTIETESIALELVGQATELMKGLLRDMPLWGR